MKFKHVRDYNRKLVSNIFAVGERIEWGEDQYPGDNWQHVTILVTYTAGTITKINPTTVYITVEYPPEKAGDIRLNKEWLARHTWNNDDLRKAIGDSLPQKKLDNTPHDAYRLRDPRDRAVFYVGISKNIQRRYKQHLACSGLNFKLNLRIQEILQCGLLPELEIIETAMPGLTKSKERERFWINHHIQAGDILTNIAEMGDTVDIEVLSFHDEREEV